MSEHSVGFERARDLDRLLPLKPDVFLILSILAESPRHGYGIMQAAEEWPGGAREIQAGALYRRLKWMLTEGLIDEVEVEVEEEEREEGRGRDRRRSYRVTPFGRLVATREARRMGELLKAARDANLVVGSNRSGGI